MYLTTFSVGAELDINLQVGEATVLAVGHSQELNSISQAASTVYPHGVAPHISEPHVFFMEQMVDFSNYFEEAIGVLPVCGFYTKF